MLESDKVNDTVTDSTVISETSDIQIVTPSRIAPRYRSSPGKEMFHDIRNTEEENIEVMAKHFKCFQCFQCLKMLMK